MAYGIRRFEIQLDRISGVYAPGDTIKGRVLVELYKPKCIKALRVFVKGACNIDDTKGRTSKPGESVIAEETYFHSNILLIGGNEEVTLPVGENQYFFHYELPENAPNTFCHKFGSIRYTIKVVMERPWKFDHELNTFFRIEAPLRLDALSMTPIDEIDAKNLSGFLPCFTNGYARFRFRLPQNGFNCHEKIPLNIKYVNKSRVVNVKKITCSLIQYVTFHNRQPFHNKRVVKNVIETATKSGPFPKGYEGVLELKVPDITISFMKHCSLIDVNYQLYVTVSFTGCNFKLKRLFDVIIASSTREFYDSEILFSPNERIVHASANSTEQTVTYNNQKPDVVDNVLTTEFSPSHDSIVSNHHEVDHDRCEESQNNYVVDREYCEESQNHHVVKGNHHNTDSDNHYCADGSNHHE